MSIDKRHVKMQAWGLRNELKILRQSLNHLRYLSRYVNTVCRSKRPLVANISGIIEELRREIDDTIDEIENILGKNGQMDISDLNVLDLALRRARLTEFVINSLERYLIQRAECVNVVQNWPSVYTLSSVSSLDDTYLVYDEFARVVAQSMGVKDLDVRPIIIVFGLHHEIASLPGYRIIHLPRQARYSLRNLAELAHEIAHIKIFDNECDNITNMLGWYMELMTKVFGVNENNWRPIRGLVVNRKAMTPLELAADIIKQALIDRVLFDMCREHCNESMLGHVLDRVPDLSIHYNLKPGAREYVSNVIDYFREKLWIHDDQKRRIYNILLLLYAIHRVHENAEGEISTFPGSFILARDILMDGVEYQLEKMEDFLSSDSYILMLIKMSTNFVVHEVNGNVMDAMIKAMADLEVELNERVNIFGFTYSIIPLSPQINFCAVTGWFDYAILIRSNNAREVIETAENVLTQGYIDDLTIIAGKSPLGNVFIDWEHNRSGEDSVNHQNYAFLLDRYSRLQ